MVNCIEDFAEEPKVINGCSNLLMELMAMPASLDAPQWVCTRCRLRLR
jgi:hypothetical protein